MTREEIREGTAVRLYWRDHPTKDWSVELPETKAIYYIQADTALAYLHSQGVVIKVDRELPPNLWRHTYQEGQQSMLKAGYVAVEPLIE